MIECKRQRALSDYELAEEKIMRALQIANETSVRWFSAELNRLKGQLLLRQGHPEVAEELYYKALGIAEEQEAELWKLRAAVSLAQLYRDQHRHAAAIDILARFTVGLPKVSARPIL